VVTERTFIHPLPRWAHKRPVTALMCCISILVIGIFSLQELPLEFAPETASTWMWINIPYYNSTPEEVDKLIGEPLESQLNFMRSVKSIRLTSSTMGCSANIQFESDANMDNAYLEARDALERVKSEFPSEVGEPRIYRQKSDDIPILWMGLAVPGKNIDELYWIVNDRIKPAIERVKGIASVIIHGLEGENLHIDLDIDRVQSHNISLARLYSSLSLVNENPSVGYLEIGETHTLVRAPFRLNSEEDYAMLPIGKRDLRLKDIAHIERRLPEKESIHHINGEAGFTISVNKESTANAVEVGRNVRKALDALTREPDLENLSILPFFDQSRMILSSLQGLLQTGLWGALFALLVLYLFIRNIGATFIIMLSIPLSVLAAIIGLYFAGFSMNIGTMMGLMLAIGMLVDNSVVSAENIYRYRKITSNHVKASILGASQVGTAINASTLTTIIVFLPLIFASGEIGIWMKQIGFPIALSLVASLFIALSLVPLAITRFIRKPFTHESRIIPEIIRKYIRLLEIILDHKLITCLIIIALLSSISIALEDIPMNMDGDPAMRQQIIRLVPPENYDLNQRGKILSNIEQVLLSNREYIDLKDLYCSMDLDNGFLRLFLRDTGDELLQDEVVRERIREIMPNLPGVNWWFGWSEGDSTGNIVDITFQGNSPETLKQLADESEKYLLAEPGIVDVTLHDESAMQEIHLSVNKQLAQINGISPMDIAQTVGIALMGRKVSRFHSNDREIDVRLQLQPEDRESLFQLLNLQIFTPDGRSLPLKTITDVEVVPGPGSIKRTNGKVIHTVQIELAERDIKEGKKIVKRALSKMNLPTGYSWNPGRSFTDYDMGFQQIGQAFILASILVLLLLGALFESLLHPFTILLSLPFALIGTFWALRISGTELNITGNIGLIILIGIVVNNAIVLVDHVNQLRAKGLERRESLLQAGKDRFRPIIMTAATTILGLAPMAMARGSLSARMYSSLAVTVMGGLITSTILTLLVLPLFYTLMDNFQQTVLRWLRSF